MHWRIMSGNRQGIAALGRKQSLILKAAGKILQPFQKSSAVDDCNIPQTRVDLAGTKYASLYTVAEFPHGRIWKNRA